LQLTQLLKLLRAESVFPCLEKFQQRQLIAFVRRFITAKWDRIALADERRDVSKKHAPLVTDWLIPGEESRYGQGDSRRLAPMPGNPAALVLLPCRVSHGAPLDRGLQRSFKEYAHSGAKPNRNG